MAPRIMVMISTSGPETPSVLCGADEARYRIHDKQDTFNARAGYGLTIRRIVIHGRDARTSLPN